MMSSETCRRAIVICGPSGVGKSTLLERLLRQHPQHYAFAVSHTTRERRLNEIDGVHYHFVSRTAFEKSAQSGEFVEWAEFVGNLYGTSIAALEQVMDSGATPILDLDVQGVQSLRQLQGDSPLDKWSLTFLFLAPPSMDELRRRLMQRGDNVNAVENRLQQAHVDLEKARATPALFDITITVVSDRDAAYLAFEDAILVKSK